MTDEQAGVKPRTVDPLAPVLDRPLTEMTVGELMALKDEFAKRGIHIYNSLNPELLALLAAASAAAAIYTKALMETLGRRSGEALADLIRIRKDGTTTEAHIGPPGDEWPKVVLTSGMPDEAWLAMFDIDIADDAVRAKELCWDSSASAWRPDPDDQ